MGGVASGQGRSTGSPGQQSDPLIVSVRTGEQLPAPEFLDVRHVVPVPGVLHQGFQGLHSRTGEGRQQTGGPPQPHPYYRCDPVPPATCLSTQTSLRICWCGDSPRRHRLTFYNCGTKAESAVTSPR